MHVPMTILRDIAQTTAHQPTTRAPQLQFTVAIAIASIGVIIALSGHVVLPPLLLRLQNQLEIHVHWTVNVHRVHAMVTVVAPKDNLPDALHVIRMVIAVHVMQDIIDHLMSVFNAAVVKPVFRDRHRLRIVQLRLRNQMEQYVR